jgi:hypothetical protein
MSAATDYGAVWATWSLQPTPPLAHVPVRQYRYGDDPVPLVPWLPGVFEHMRALVQIGWPALNPIADHAIAKYEAEVAGAVAAAA